MKLAVSNIAWPSGTDREAAAILHEHGATGVELAPTKLWRAPVETSEPEAQAVRRSWEKRGFQVVALQALLFGQPHLTLFEGPHTRKRMVEYLAAIIRLAGWLGCTALVFGSPKNRLKGERTAEEVLPEAVEALCILGDEAHRAGVVFGIEPNPPLYGCDWMTTVAETSQFVRLVRHPGIGLHLDAGGMTVTGESPAVGTGPCHYHVSEPNLVPIGEGGSDHPRFARDLLAQGYDQWHSIEMRQPTEGWQRALAAALRCTREHYRAA